MTCWGVGDVMISNVIWAPGMFLHVNPAIVVLSPLSRDRQRICSRPLSPPPCVHRADIMFPSLSHEDPLVSDACMLTKNEKNIDCSDWRPDWWPVTPLGLMHDSDGGCQKTVGDCYLLCHVPSTEYIQQALGVNFTFVKLTPTSNSLFEQSSNYIISPARRDGGNQHSENCVMQLPQPFMFAA